MQASGMASDSLSAIDWSTLTIPALTQEQVDALEAPIGRFFLTLTKRGFYEGAVARGMLGYPVSTVADISADPQLEARAFWQPLDDAAAGRRLRYPGGFAIVNGERLPIRRGAPRPGEHTEEILGLLSGADRAVPASAHGNAKYQDRAVP
jgi:crotonobetainyl-CoA:carnitine CoA-transferase CaiB-like acyl-CoA transferase